MSARESKKGDEQVLVTMGGKGSKDDRGDNIRHGDTSLECSTMNANAIATRSKGVRLHAKVDEAEKSCMDERGACARKKKGEGDEDVERGG